VTVGATLASGGDPSIVVKYPEGEKRIVIPANAHVVRNTFGSKDDLKAGRGLPGPGGDQAAGWHLHGHGHQRRQRRRPAVLTRSD